LGGIVRARRLEAGLTQEQLAELSGLSVRTISDIERRTTGRPRRSSIALLEAALTAADPNPAGPNLADPNPPLPAVVPRQLPPGPGCFVGRETELKALTEFIGGHQIAGGTVVIRTVAGTAGVGKTALAVRWAHTVAAQFPDGQLFVNLRGYDPDQPLAAGDALAGFLRALGVPSRDVPAEESERTALYRSLLAGRRMLVVLDNAGSEEQVRPLLPGAPTCAVVVTSRDSLAGLVAREGAERLDLDLLSVHEAIELLRGLLRERVVADTDAVQALAGQCSRLPLALRVAAELVAARPAVPLAELAAELADQRRLDLLDAAGDPRTGVRAVFSWSYQHLDAGTACAFRLLGLHPGPDFDSCATAALTGVPLEQAVRLLGVLARAHLIQPTAPAGTACMICCATTLASSPRPSTPRRSGGTR
jgi:transcriptional regulator with XRE-family HTH domain